MRINLYYYIIIQFISSTQQLSAFVLHSNRNFKSQVGVVNVLVSKKKTTHINTSTY